MDNLVQNVLQQTATELASSDCKVIFKGRVIQDANAVLSHFGEDMFFCPIFHFLQRLQRWRLPNCVCQECPLRKMRAHGGWSSNFYLKVCINTRPGSTFFCWLLFDAYKVYEQLGSALQSLSLNDNSTPTVWKHVSALLHTYIPPRNH